MSEYIIKSCTTITTIASRYLDDMKYMKIYLAIWLLYLWLAYAPAVTENAPYTMATIHLHISISSVALRYIFVHLQDLYVSTIIQHVPS